MSKTYAVPPIPPHNEGKTPAAWTMTIGVVLGSIIAAFGMIIPSVPAIIIGAVVMLVSIVVSSVMSLAGLGKKRTSAASS